MKNQNESIGVENKHGNNKNKNNNNKNKKTDIIDSFGSFGDYVNYFCIFYSIQTQIQTYSRAANQAKQGRLFDVPRFYMLQYILYISSLIQCLKNHSKERERERE